MNKPSVLADELSKGKAVLSGTSGDSMQPLLYQGKTQIVLVPITSPLKKWDLPLYRRPSGQFVLHRIIKSDDEFYYTRGDNRHGLEKVPKEWCLGVVSEIKRAGKTISVTDKGYRAYLHFWSLIYPFRYVWYRIRSIIKSVRRRLK